MLSATAKARLSDDFRPQIGPVDTSEILQGLSMRNKLFVILGAQDQEKGRKISRPLRRNRDEPNLDILKESPCLGCQLYVENTACLYVNACSKIDEFQQVAAVHCTLYKDHDVFSILKI